MTSDFAAMQVTAISSYGRLETMQLWRAQLIKSKTLLLTEANQVKLKGKFAHKVHIMTKIIVAILQSKTAKFEKFIVQLKGTAKPPAKVRCVICFLKNCTIKRKVRVSTVISQSNRECVIIE